MNSLLQNDNFMETQIEVLPCCYLETTFIYNSIRHS